MDAQQRVLVPVELLKGHRDPDENAAKQNATTRHLEALPAGCSIWSKNICGCCGNHEEDEGSVAGDTVCTFYELRMKTCAPRCVHCRDHA